MFLFTVKPNKVTEFSVTSTDDSHCVVLSWQYDTSYSHRLQYARIRYVSQRSNVVKVCRSTDYQAVSILKWDEYLVLLM